MTSKDAFITWLKTLDGSNFALADNDSFKAGYDACDAHWREKLQALEVGREITLTNTTSNSVVVTGVVGEIVDPVITLSELREKLQSEEMVNVVMNAIRDELISMGYVGKFRDGVTPLAEAGLAAISKEMGV